MIRLMKQAAEAVNTLKGGEYDFMLVCIAGVDTDSCCS